MELDLLPENVVINILRNLDLHEVVRYSRVCQRWRDLCQFILETNVQILDLSQNKYWRLNPDSLAWILRSCSGTVREIIFPHLKNATANIQKGSQTTPVDPYTKLNITRWCQTLAEFRLVNLRILNLGDASTDKNCVETILASNPNLEVFKWSTPDPNGLEFGDAQSNTWRSRSLKQVDLGCLYATDALFASLSRNCQKLQQFTANSHFRKWTPAGLDRFCQSCPNMRVLNLKVGPQLTSTGIYVVPILFDPPRLTTDLTHFWNLGQLLFLSLPFEGGLFDDEALHRISLCFPYLHTLQFGDSSLSSDGVANLCMLRQLRCLTMAQVTGNIDDGLMMIAEQGRLRKLNLAMTKICFQTLLYIIQHCPELTTLNISQSVSNYQVHRGISINAQQAVRIIEFRKHMYDIGVARYCLTLIHSDPAVWTSMTVKSAVQNMGPDFSDALRIIAVCDYYKMDYDEDVYDWGD